MIMIVSRYLISSILAPFLDILSYDSYKKHTTLKS
jgi:hypothetical protein